jgi:hypothetical protein
MVREMEGQEQQGQAINRNELQVNDAESMHVPDLREFSEEDAESIRSLVSDWMDRERDASERDYEAFQDNLDRAVLSAFGVGYVNDEDGERVLDEELLTEKADEIREAVSDLLERREKGAGLETEVLIGEDRRGEGEDDGDEFDLPGATRISDGGQSSISDW